jgi:hypothetical protein
LRRASLEWLPIRPVHDVSVSEPFDYAIGKSKRIFQGIDQIDTEDVARRDRQALHFRKARRLDSLLSPARPIDRNPERQIITATAWPSDK